MAELPQNQCDLHDDSGVNSGRSSKSTGDIKGDGIAEVETGVSKMKEKMLEDERLLSVEREKTQDLRSEIMMLRSTIVAKDQEIDSLNARLTEVFEILQKSQELLAQVGAHHDIMRKISNRPKILHPIQESQDQSRQPTSHTGNNKKMTRSTSQPTLPKHATKSVPSTQTRSTSPQKGQHPGSKVAGRAKPFKSSSSKTPSK